MVTPKDTTNNYHGGDGLMDVEENDFSIDEYEIQKENGVSAIIRLINQNPHFIDLIG